MDIQNDGLEKVTPFKNGFWGVSLKQNFNGRLDLQAQIL